MENTAPNHCTKPAVRLKECVKVHPETISSHQASFCTPPFSEAAETLSFCLTVECQSPTITLWKCLLAINPKVFFTVGNISDNLTDCPTLLKTVEDTVCVVWTNFWFGSWRFVCMLLSCYCCFIFCDLHILFMYYLFHYLCIIYQPRTKSLKPYTCGHFIKCY